MSKPGLGDVAPQTPHWGQSAAPSPPAQGVIGTDEGAVYQCYSMKHNFNREIFWTAGLAHFPLSQYHSA